MTTETDSTAPANPFPTALAGTPTAVLTDMIPRLRVRATNAHEAGKKATAGTWEMWAVWAEAELVRRDALADTRRAA